MQVLEGIKVIDLTYFFPGGYCTRILADHGARVIKVERPGDLSDMAAIWPWANDPVSLKRKALSARYIQMNCGKQSLLCDYTTLQGKEILLKLVEVADVLVEGFRPGIMDSYGLGYAQLKDINPALVYCSISGFGQHGPLAQYPCHDINIQAMSGILSLTQGPNNGPGLPGMPVADVLAGNNAAIAVLLALIARPRNGGVGQHLDVSMSDGIVWAMGLTRADTYFPTGKYLEANRRQLHIFETKDGEFICMLPLEKKFWEILCNRLGLGEFISDWAAFQPYSKDTPHRRQMVSRFAEIFRTKTRQEWFELLCDSCLTPVLDFEEVWEHPNTKAREMVVWMEEKELGEVPCLGVPFKMSATPGRVQSPAPLKGEHSQQILSELETGRP